MKIKKHIIDLKLFPKKIQVLIGQRKESNIFLKRFTKFGLFDDAKAQAGRFSNYRNAHYYIWIPNLRCHSSIAHEAVHISWFINDDLSLNYNSECDEQQTYLVGYIVEQINLIR